jgi:hypothetical protein
MIKGFHFIVLILICEANYRISSGINKQPENPTALQAFSYQYLGY